MKKELNNLAFIDGQNLHLGTKENNWSIDYIRFSIYLRDKYNVKEAYYFLGFVSDNENYLYQNLQKAGFILVFREHSSILKGKKKGNVDSDIIFEVMRRICEREEFNKIIIVSGDGDYKKLVDYLIKKKKFEKILFPNYKFASSLYDKLGTEYYDNLEQDDIKRKIAYKRGH